MKPKPKLLQLMAIVIVSTIAIQASAKISPGDSRNPLNRNGDDRIAEAPATTEPQVNGPGWGEKPEPGKVEVMKKKKKKKKSKPS